MTRRRDKRTYVFYESWRDALSGFPAEIRLEVREAIDSFVFDGQEEELSPVSRGLFALIKGKIADDIDKFNDTCEKQRKRIQDYWDIKKRKKEYHGIPRNTTEYNGIPRNTTATENENENENESTNVDKIKKEILKKKVFKKPSREELQEYAFSRGLQDHSEDFLLYYESNGWMVGRNHMKDWKSAYSRWCRNSKAINHEDRTSNSAEQRRIDISASIARDIASCH